MPSYELLYFNAYGRAEPIRQCFTYAGIPFKDNRIEFNDWPTTKGDTKRIPYGQVPILLIDGKPLAESHTITRYAGRVSKLDGNTPEETAFIDQAYEITRTFYDSAFPYFKVVLGFSEGDKEQLKKEVFAPAAEKQLKNIENLLQPSGFFGPSGPTYVDFFYAQITEFYNQHAPEVLGKYPASLEHAKRVHRLSQLQEYFKNRPSANF
ncbi:unnamed protein product [Bursaphelenchus okinawaensis]|uniref:glutathione transferase n=1 Tax=Bursaphelenchus okinawaensis TaxID=465554 RepID=A0A811KE05_9BILA|nr:unnamed protein product [Bursaphelenchus okinawaensis]CAG9101429.1 unnamed protein product [Bursaphelenchus okinawaensis]